MYNFTKMIGKPCEFSQDENFEYSSIGVLEEIKEYHTGIEFVPVDSIFCDERNNWERDFKYCRLAKKDTLLNILKNLKTREKVFKQYLKQVEQGEEDEQD